jgi:hypothetical protein
LTDWLHDPFVQSGAVPFLAGLVAAAVLRPVRLGGLAAGAGFLAAVWLIGNFAWEPLTAGRKLVVAGMAAMALGALIDLANVRLGTTARVVLGLAFGAAAVWMLWAVLMQRPPAMGLGIGAGAFALVAWLAGTALASGGDTVRAGAAGVALGVGSGVAAMLGGSALLAQYGIALGAASGAFLLVATLAGGRATEGAGLALTAAVVAGLVIVGSAVLAQLSWLAVAAFALVPAAVRLPLPAAGNAWLRAVLALLYACVPAGLACAVAWWASRGGAA